MADEVREIGRMRIPAFSTDGPTLICSQDANDLMGAARSQPAQIVAQPIERLDPADSLPLRRVQSRKYTPTIGSAVCVKASVEV